MTKLKKKAKKAKTSSTYSDQFVLHKVNSSLYSIVLSLQKIANDFHNTMTSKKVSSRQAAYIHDRLDYIYAATIVLNLAKIDPDT